MVGGHEEGVVFSELKHFFGDGELSLIIDGEGILLKDEGRELSVGKDVLAVVGGLDIPLVRGEGAMMVVWRRLMCTHFKSNI